MREFKLYVILDEDVCKAHGDITEIARQVILGGADALQLRAKSSSDRKILKLAESIKSLVKRSNTLFILNDRVDLARIINTDGVHLGQQDLSVKDARDILGADKIIGVSTHSLEEALQAQAENADYIGLGPVFPTKTKPQTEAFGPQIITKIKDKVKIPFVAVGGITLGNLAQVLASGAGRIAVCRSIVCAKDVLKATSEFRRRLNG